MAHIETHLTVAVTEAESALNHLEQGVQAGDQEAILKNWGLYQYWLGVTSGVLLAAQGPIRKSSSFASAMAMVEVMRARALEVTGTKGVTPP